MAITSHPSTLSSSTLERDARLVSSEPHDVAPGDIATLFGGLVTLDEQARSAGTISYELLTSLGPRLPRRYG